MITNSNLLTESKENSLSQLTEKLYQSANKTVNFFEKKLKQDGSYGEEIQDICCYYKSPMMFISAGKTIFANQLLDFVKNKFMLKNGDFLTAKNLKSIKPEYEIY